MLRSRFWIFVMSILLVISWEAIPLLASTAHLINTCCYRPAHESVNTQTKQHKNLKTGETTTVTYTTAKCTDSLPSIHYDPNNKCHTTINQSKCDLCGLNCKFNANWQQVTMTVTKKNGDSYTQGPSSFSGTITWKVRNHSHGCCNP
jgi:hypothetical protein